MFEMFRLYVLLRVDNFQAFHFVYIFFWFYFGECENKFNNKSKSPSQSVAGAKSETEKMYQKSFCAQSKHIFPLNVNHAFGCSYQ